jgi:hypothetical protein
MRSSEAPVYFTHADLQRRYDCSRVWVRRQIQKNRFPEPITFGKGVGARPHWSVPLVLEWESEWMTKPINNTGAGSLSDGGRPMARTS